MCSVFTTLWELALSHILQILADCRCSETTEKDWVRVASLMIQYGARLDNRTIESVVDRIS